MSGWINMARLSYIKTELMEKFDWVEGDIIGRVNSFTTIRSNSDFVLLSVLKLLFPLSAGQLNFMKLYNSSGLRMKKSFINYLDFCIQMKLVNKLEKDGLYQYYEITDKGRLLLNIFYLNGDDE
jgi:predicted transcriptional regulator